MHGPKLGTDISDRILEGQEGIERAFLALVAEARGAGWTHLEACLALIELADKCVLGAPPTRIPTSRLGISSAATISAGPVGHSPTGVCRDAHGISSVQSRDTNLHLDD